MHPESSWAFFKPGSALRHDHLKLHPLSAFGTATNDAPASLELAKEIFKTQALSNKNQVSFSTLLVSVMKSSSMALKLDQIVPVIEEKLAELAAFKDGAGKND